MKQIINGKTSPLSSFSVPAKTTGVYELIR